FDVGPGGPSSVYAWPKIRRRSRGLRPAKAGALRLFSLEPFDTPAFIDDTLEQTLQTFVIERPRVRFLYSTKDFALPLRIVNAEILSMFDLPNLDGAFRTLVEQLNEPAVNFINFAAPIFDAHLQSEPFNQPANLATLSTKSGLPRCSSICLTIELPTTAASASCHTALTCSGREIPNPTAIGSAV